MMRVLSERVLPEAEMNRLIDSIARRQLDPYTAAESVARRMEA